MTGIEIALGAAAIGTAAMGAVSAIQAGNTAKASADYNAKVDRIQAGTAAETGAAQAARVEDQTRRQIAIATNAASGSGAQISSGTPLDVMTDLAKQGALDAEITRWNAGNKASAAVDQSQIDAYSGVVAQQAGYTKAATSVLSAASSYGTTLYGRRATAPVG